MITFQPFIALKNFVVVLVAVFNNLSIKYGAAYGFHSQQYALHTSLNVAIDKLAEHMTGDPKFFWQMNHTAGGRPGGMTPRQERELRWQELRRKY